jgi:DNA invertase Pin-like site-specific DNA recombinase
MKYSMQSYPNLLLDRNRERQVVFYGRVSTEHEAQISALENQMQWYDTQAEMHSNWKVIGRYIDEGITGTQAKKRPAFLNMIEDAKKGKFDLIVTREVCRFARNTVDTLVTTRELRNIGIEVYFVEDNIWTMDGDGELRLTIMATLAQEESRKVSERVKAGQQISREKGVVYGRGNILGYDRVGGTYVINEEQAETVRLIYKMYVEDGAGTTFIASELERLGKKTAMGMTHWHVETITAILKNPTYTGFQAYGKSFSNNYLEQKRIQNRDRQSYMYKKCDYEPIISQELFIRAQEIRESKTSLCYTSETIEGGRIIKRAHVVSRFIWARKVVDQHGVPYRRSNWHQPKNGDKQFAYLNRRRDGSTKPISIAEWKLELMGEKIAGYIAENLQDFAAAIRKNIELKDKETKDPAGKTVTEDALTQRLEVLFEMRANREITAEEYVKRKAETEAELEVLRSIERSDSKIVIDPKALAETIRKLKTALSESASTYDIVEKLVSKIVPEDSSHFNWHIRIDGGEVVLPVESSGRKNFGTVMIQDTWKNE